MRGHLAFVAVANVMSRFGVYLLTRILFMGLMAMSVNLLMGFGGLTSLAQGRLCRNRRLRLAICRATYKMDYRPAY